MRLQAGDKSPDFKLTDIDGNTHSLESLAGSPVMLSFYRFSACPLCNLRVSTLLRAYPRMEQRGLKMIAFFQSSESNIRRYVGRLNPPFPIVSDTKANYYDLFRLELASDSDMQSYETTLRSVYERAVQAGFTGGTVDGNIRQIPADFLITPGGTIHTVYYGKDISDHIPMGRVENFITEFATV